ncbi:MAG TPA: ABC transporter permease, partial [Gammaproteobacteria bacterium]
GGVIGIFFGLGSSVTLSQFSEFPVSVTAWSIVLAFSFAVLVGIFFGLHPARKASRLQPIEALRYE